VRSTGGAGRPSASLALEARRHFAPARDRPLLDVAPPARMQAHERPPLEQTLRLQERVGEGPVFRGQGIDRARFGRPAGRVGHRAAVLLDPGHGLVERNHVGQQVVASGVGVADAATGPGEPEQERRAQVALEVEGEIEPIVAEPAGLGRERGEARSPLRGASNPGRAPHEHLVHREAAGDRLAPAAHRQAEARLRSGRAQVVERGPGHEHVADPVETEDEDLARVGDWPRHRPASEAERAGDGEDGAGGRVQHADQGPLPRIVDAVAGASNGRPALPPRHRPLRTRARPRPR
jgi:hypothetical protein